jgi:hypothetical protein
MRTNHIVVAIALAAAIPAAPALASGSKVVNTTIYTTYTFNTTNSEINWITCGSTQQSEGCFGSGQITGFGKVCGVLDTVPESNGMVTRQKLYIFDSDVKHGSNLYLDVYEKTDVTTVSSNTTTFTLKTKLALPIQAGPKVKCFASANSGYIFVGTSTGTSAVRISKADLSQTPVGGFSPPIPVTSIDVDAAGYVSVNFGNGTETGFVLFGPTGGGAEDGGGNAVIFNDSTAYTP